MDINMILNPFDEFYADFLKTSKVLKEYDSSSACRALAVKQDRRFNKSSITALLQKYIKSYETDLGIDSKLSINSKEFSLKDGTYLLTVTAIALDDEGNEYSMTLVAEDVSDSWVSVNMPVIVDIRVYDVSM